MHGRCLKREGPDLVTHVRSGQERGRRLGGASRAAEHSRSGVARRADAGNFACHQARARRGRSSVRAG